MKKKREIVVDEPLEAAIQSAIAAGVPISAVCRQAGVDQSTLFKWRRQMSSPTMNNRQAVLDAVAQLVEGR